MNKKAIKPDDISSLEFYRLMIGSVAPRPIALSSTVNSQGDINLSPFSFFNAFGSNPPILIFSPVTRSRDGTNKDTLLNLKEVPEVVINICSTDMVEQIALASHEYDASVNEFEKSGLTPIDSKLVKPPLVGESKVSFECRVNQIIETGHGGGAGNLVICEVLIAHVNTDVIQEGYSIDPYKMKFLARLGASYYAQVNEGSIFEVEKNINGVGIGVDALPSYVFQSKILTGNDIGKLGAQFKIPDENEVKAYIIASVKDIEAFENIDVLLSLVKRLLESGETEHALKALYWKEYF